MPHEQYSALNQSLPYEDVDLFTSDRPLREAVSANGAGSEFNALAAFGRRWGSAEMFELGRQANERPPVLKRFDARGFRRDTVEFHPAYHLFMAESIAGRLQASTQAAMRAMASVGTLPRCGSAIMAA